MSSLTITVDDKDVQAAIKGLVDKVRNLAPVWRTIGEHVVERTRHRFETSTGPDGAGWQAYSSATVNMLISRLGASHRKKNDDLNAKGKKAVANKKPLIATRELMDGIRWSFSSDGLTIATSAPIAPYAPIQQFGGKVGRGHKLTIPARPYLPVYQDASLYTQEKELILRDINAYLIDGLT